MSGDPKAKFKKYVGAESGGGRPKGKGFITELQRQKLKPAHLDVIVAVLLVHDPPLLVHPWH